MICEFCLPFTQTLNWPVCPCKWETTGVSCVKLHSPSISIRLAFFWFRMTNNSRWSDFRPTIQQSDMVFTNVSPSSWKLQRRNKKTSFIAFTINKEGKSGAVYSEQLFVPTQAPIRYVTLHFRGQRSAASLRYPNRAEITVLLFKRKLYLVWFSCRRKSFPV